MKSFSILNNVPTLTWRSVHTTFSEENRGGLCSKIYAPKFNVTRRNLLSLSWRVFMNTAPDRNSQPKDNFKPSHVKEILHSSLQWSEIIFRRKKIWMAMGYWSIQSGSIRSCWLAEVFFYVQVVDGGVERTTQALFEKNWRGDRLAN